MSQDGSYCNKSGWEEEECQDSDDMNGDSFLLHLVRPDFGNVGIKLSYTHIVILQYPIKLQCQKVRSLLTVECRSRDGDLHVPKI